MNFFKNFQAEIKTFLIVAVVAIILTVGGILLLRTMESAPFPTPVAQQAPPPAYTAQTQWNWELLGCGSQARVCSYRVCSATDSTDCYSCGGKYDNPSLTTDPRTTKDFICAKEVQKPIIPTDKKSCEAKGGTWEPTGLLQGERCDLPTSDAGESCTDSSQCESVCVTDDEILPDTKTTGKCYERTQTLGTCLNYVLDGKAQGTLCQD